MFDAIRRFFRARIHRFATHETTWREGRAWWNWKWGKLDRESWRPHSLGVHVEWHFGGCAWPLGFGVDANTEDHGVAAKFHVWRVYLYGEIEGVLPQRFTKWLYAKHKIADEINVFSLDVSPYTIRWKLWLDGIQSTIPGTYKRAPRWRDIYFDIPDFIFGGTIYTSTDVGEPVAIEIPMPERKYPATVQRQVSTWRRPRWPGVRTREYIDLKIPPPGLPFAGKGENSWDSGDDGYYGMSSESHSIAKAIGHAVTATLERREQYGDPSWLRDKAV